MLKPKINRDNFFYPDYRKNSLANLPATILSLFGKKTTGPTPPTKIILFLIDGLGFNSLQRYGSKDEFFRTLIKKGLVRPITSVFPSTTAAAITTINSGQTPQEHGLFEWFVYFPEIDRIIMTLPFSLPGEKAQDTLLKEGLSPKILFSGQTIFQKLGKLNIASFFFTPQKSFASAYTKLISSGAERVGYKDGPDLITKLVSCLESDQKPAYFYVYWENIDSASHHYGPGSKEYLEELAKLSLLFQDLLKKVNEPTARQTLFLITADHGGIGIKPEETILLDRFPKLSGFLARGKNGQPIIPTGNPRDVFLHIKKEQLEKAKKYLEEKLEKKAKVITIREAIKQQLFGLGKPSQKFLERAGNLLITPYKNYTVWYAYPGLPPTKFLGHHGGLSEEEMLIPLCVSSLSDLR